MATETKKAPAAGPTAETLLDLLRTMPEAERLKAEELAGTAFPRIPPGETGGERVFCYPCTYCGGMGLEFLGTEFPGGRPWDEIRWVQDKGTRKTPQMKRHAPICQYCYASLGSGVVKSRRVVPIEVHASNSKALKLMRKRIHDPYRDGRFQQTEALTNTDGSPVTLPPGEISDDTAILNARKYTRADGSKSSIPPTIHVGPSGQILGTT